MKTTLVSAVLLAMFAIFATKGYACFCVKSEVSQAYDEAKAVFIGEVTEIVPPRTDDPNADLTEHLTVLFSCNRTAYLGNAADDLRELRTLQNPFFRFERERKFLERDFFEDAHNKRLQRTRR